VEFSFAFTFFFSLGKVFQGVPGLGSGENSQVFMQESCAEGVHQVADVAICFEFVATNVELGVVGIVCRLLCSLDDGNAFLLEGVGAEDDERFIGIEVLHESQGAATFTPALRIFGLHENVPKLVVAGRWVLRYMCGADESLEDILHFVFVTFVEVVLQDGVVLRGEIVEGIIC